jgi:hypothetical protein
MPDITFIQIRNNKKEILDYMYLGVIKFTNKYSLEIYKYINTNTNLYFNESKNHKNLITYAVWNENIINNIKNLVNDAPNNNLESELESELELYNLINNILNWINLKVELYKDHDIHILCVTTHDK